MHERPVTIINRLGLHARAAAKLVTTASSFSSEVELSKNGRTVNGKSIMGVMMLAASRGTELVLITNGSDEIAAADTLEALIADRFGETE
ncbi:MAG: HPr family phosphocarrier protein [Gammaproteobacteria bacterium]|jgi:phosphocarrier protein|nr:HPr family phosphocarrier protein [Gammaproteobacteria bacterium]MDH5514736.1 HPr family phosphocarrier protein [Gammaproteobacteria bacterium]HSG10433.1 HPr family phosphocarrier protein [Gammaproteobacteria bacterium]